MLSLFIIMIRMKTAATKMYIIMLSLFIIPKKRLVQKCTLSFQTFLSLPRGGRKGCYKNVQYHAKPFHHYEEKAHPKMYTFMLRIFIFMMRMKKALTRMYTYHYVENEKDTKTCTFLLSLFINMKKRLLQKCILSCCLFIIMKKRLIQKCTLSY